MTGGLAERARTLLAELPSGVELVAAAKTRAPSEIAAVLAGGARIVVESDVREAERTIGVLGSEGASWHLIGRLQRNEPRDAVRLPVLVEIKNAEEEQKSGILPDEAVESVCEAATLPPRFGSRGRGRWARSRAIRKTYALLPADEGPRLGGLVRIARRLDPIAS